MDGAALGGPVRGTSHPRCPGRSTGESAEAAFLPRTSRTLVCSVQRLFPAWPRGTSGDMSHFLDSNLSQHLSRSGRALSYMRLLFKSTLFPASAVSLSGSRSTCRVKRQASGPIDLTGKQPVNSPASSFYSRWKGRRLAKRSQEPISQVRGDFLPCLG